MNDDQFDGADLAVVAYELKYVRLQGTCSIKRADPAVYDLQFPSACAEELSELTRGEALAIAARNRSRTQRQISLGAYRVHPTSCLGRVKLQAPRRAAAAGQKSDDTNG